MSDDKKEVKVFTTKSCAPCRSIVQKMMDGDVDRPVAIIDIETEDGFEEFSKLVLSNGDGHVPCAFLKNEQCQIFMSEADTIIIKCPSDPPDDGDDVVEED